MGHYLGVGLSFGSDNHLLGQRAGGAAGAVRHGHEARTKDAEPIDGPEHRGDPVALLGREELEGQSSLAIENVTDFHAVELCVMEWDSLSLP